MDEHPGEVTFFAAEVHLREFLSLNLHLIESDLELFVDDQERDGVEYLTDVGFIDICMLIVRIMNN